jgi:prepilin-type N-terminal cleavage/methylation domain-containing protein
MVQEVFVVRLLDYRRGMEVRIADSGLETFGQDLRERILIHVSPAQDGGVNRDRARSCRVGRGQSGFGLVEILVVAVILAVVGTFLYQYFLSTTKTVEIIQQQKPMSAARLAADRATVAAIRTSLQLYFGEHGGYPPSKDVVATLLNPPPSFQCEGNDYRYEPATGQVTLVIDDVNRC